MRCAWLLPLLLPIGCSTAPLAGFLDWVAPGPTRPSDIPLPPPGKLGDPVPLSPSPPIPETPPKTKPATVPPLEPVPTNAASSPTRLGDRSIDPKP